MTRFLIVAATHGEAAFLSKTIQKAKTGKVISLELTGKILIDVLITGPGIAATTYYLTRLLSTQRYDLAINIGICGSLDPDTGPVKVVNIVSDRFGDFGAEDGSNVLDIFEMGLTRLNDPPFKNGKVHATYKDKLNSLQALPAVNGITVQRAHGSLASCRKAFAKFGPVMETMEGAAFFYVCNLEKITCLQIRAVSNKVEKRNRDRWKITEAINALAGITGLLLLEIENKS